MQLFHIKMLYENYFVMQVPKDNPAAMAWILKEFTK